MHASNVAAFEHLHRDHIGALGYDHNSVDPEEHGVRASAFLTLRLLYLFGDDGDEEYQAHFYECSKRDSSIPIQDQCRCRSPKPLAETYISTHKNISAKTMSKDWHQYNHSAN